MKMMKMKKIDRDYILSVIEELQSQCTTVPQGVLMEDVKRRVSEDLVNELREMWCDGLVGCHKTINSVKFNIDKEKNNGIE